MMAYRISIFLILFTLALPVIGALGIFQVPSGENPLEKGGVMGYVANWDFKGLILSGVGLLALVGALIFRVPVGAAVFATVFTFSMLPFTSTLNTFEEIGVMAEIIVLIEVIVAFVFLFAFIQLASGSGPE